MSIFIKKYIKHKKKIVKKNPVVPTRFFVITFVIKFFLLIALTTVPKLQRKYFVYKNKKNTTATEYVMVALVVVLNSGWGNVAIYTSTYNRCSVGVVRLGKILRFNKKVPKNN